GAGSPAVAHPGVRLDRAHRPRRRTQRLLLRRGRRPSGMGDDRRVRPGPHTEPAPARAELREPGGGARLPAGRLARRRVGAPRRAGESLVQSPAAWPMTDLFHLAGTFLWLSLIAVGGGLGVLPEMQRQVVTRYGWVTTREFVDGYTLAQLTPGPNMLVAIFVG